MPKILVIDDDDTLRGVILRALRRRGFETLEANNGASGVEAARRETPDLILSDVNMEQVDGYAALTELRSHPATATIPIILMTGFANAAGMRRGMESGADDYLAKPFSMDALFAAVEARLRKQETLRRQSETTRERLVAILEATTDLVLIADAQLNQINYLNRAGRELLGIGVNEDLGKLGFAEFLTDPSRTPVQHEGIPAAIRDGVWSGETALVSRSGRIVPVLQLIQTHKTPDGAVEYLSIIARDITDRKRSEEHLRESGNQMRALAERVLAVREDERKVIAREVHDELGQALTGLKMDIAWLARRLAKPVPRDKRHAVLEKLETMSGHIDQTINQVRRIASQLRPGVLDNLGLGAALEWQAGEFQKRTGVECALRLEDASLEDLPSEKCTALFRIFQEILTNVTRHARAKRVDVAVTEADGQLVMEVRDDGRGITNGEVDARRSLGILGMRERAAVFNGTVDFHGAPDEGTTVTVRIPLTEITS